MRGILIFRVALNGLVQHSGTKTLNGTTTARRTDKLEPDKETHNLRSSVYLNCILSILISMNPSTEDRTTVHTLHSNELNYGYSPSSGSSSQHSGGYADDHYGDGHDSRYGPDGGASSRSSISSLPGSVVVYPPGKMDPLPFLAHQPDPNMINIAMAKAKAAKYAGSNKKNGNGGAQGRERRSPFRHASSVRAMQMGDETDDGEMLVNGWDQMQCPSFSEVSMGSNRSIRRRPYHRHGHSSPRTMSPRVSQVQEAQQEAPLVLLHCTLLPPSLSMPRGLGTPSPQLMKEVLPPKYWQRWKLLEDKVGTDIVRERGVLISHPQDADDLLEERLLETLDLVRPRLAYGHFLGAGDDADEGEQHANEPDESKDDSDSSPGHSCADCGRFVEGHERKWDVRVYAANGLMRSGAWEAAWRGMEKIDVEVSVRLPAEVRRDIENRMLEEKAFKLEAERRLAEDEKRRREVYGDSMGPTQEEIDRLLDDEPQSPYSEPANATQYSHRVSSRLSFDDLPSIGPVHLRTLLWNYVRVLANDPRNGALFFLSILVIYLAMNTRNTRLDSSNAPVMHQPMVQFQPSSTSIVEFAAPTKAIVHNSPSVSSSNRDDGTISLSGFPSEGTAFHIPQQSSADKAEPNAEPLSSVIAAIIETPSSPPTMNEEEMNTVSEHKIADISDDNSEPFKSLTNEHDDTESASTPQLEEETFEVPPVVANEEDSLTNFLSNEGNVDRHDDDASDLPLHEEL